MVLTGTFDNWSKSLFLVKQSDGSFELTVPLPILDDRILYKYIVDGEWQTSATEKVVADESGIENNYLSSKDLVVSKSSGTRIPESGGLFVAGGNSKKGDVNTTVLPSTEGKQATIAGEPGIQIPQDKDSLAAFTKFEKPEDKDVKTAVLPSSEGQHATIAGEPGIQVPQDKESLAAFTKFENTEKSEPSTEGLTAEERKKQKKKVKRTQYKAKKKKKAAEAAAFGAAGATAAGLSGASNDAQEGSEVTEGTEGNEITTTEGETEPEATPEPQTLDPNVHTTHTLDPQAKEVQSKTTKDISEEEIIAAAGLSGVGAGVGAAAASGYALNGEPSEGQSKSTVSDKPLDEKDTGAGALGGASTGKASDVETSTPSQVAPESSSADQFLPVVEDTPAVEESITSQKPTEKDVANEPSDEGKHGKGALGAAALGGAALGGAGGAALAGSSSAAHGGDIKSDLPEYAGNASHLVDEKKLASEDLTNNKDAELPAYGGSDSRYPDEKKQAALGGAAIAGGSSKDQYSLPQEDIEDVAPTAQGNINDAYNAPESNVETSNVPYTSPQHELNNTSSEYPSEAETSKAEKYGAPALGGAAIAAGGAAIASSGHDDVVSPQAVSGDVPLIKEEPTSTLDPKAQEPVSLNKEAEPSTVVSGDSNAAEKEVDASPVTRRDGAPPLTQLASADEIVIAQGATKKDNIEAELRAREHGDVIVEEIQPTESEKQRLTEEAHLVAPKDKSTGTSNNKAASGVAGTSGSSSKKAAPVKKEAKKDAKKEEKKKKGFFSKLKSIFK